MPPVGADQVGAASRASYVTRASGDGFVWPDLLIIPDDGSTRLIWDDDWRHSEPWPIKFLGRGDVRVPSGLVQTELELLVTETITRLAEQGITNTILEREWALIKQTDSEEADYCRAAARLGLDPYSDAESYEQDILKAAETLSGQLLADFLNAVSPDRIGDCLKWVRAAQRAFEQNTVALAKRPVAFPPSLQHDDVLEPTIASSELPWEVGYPDLSLQALGVKSEPFLIISQNRPAIANRFTLSRALWHYIWDDAPLFVVTTAHAYRQSIERAFAAELLAPADGIDQLLESSPEVASQEELEQVAQHFGVSSMVIQHQVGNRLVKAA